MARRRLSDHDVELLVSGGEPDQEHLARLGTGLKTLHGEPPPPSEDRIAAFATRAAEIARSSAPTVPGALSPTPTRNLGLLKRRLATSLGAVLLLSGMTGVAAASNGAAPGDALYGIDRALEAVGLADGGASERISEAQRLFNRGFVAEAVEHAAEAVESDGDDPAYGDAFSPEAARASQALLGAADSVKSDEGDEQSQEVRDAVAAMLAEMAEMAGDDDFDGQTFGQRISEMARSISGLPNPTSPTGDDARPSDEEPRGAEEQPGSPGPPEGVPSGPPAGTPGGPPAGTPGGPPAGAPGRP